MHHVPMTIQVVGITQFIPPADVPWSTDSDGGQALAEFAGRACYQSWGKPNPATATNRGYLAHILEVGHLSVLEHGQVSIYFTGVSRSFTHEMVRHRHFSYSQLSQRYVADQGAVVEPEIIAEDPELHGIFARATEHAAKAYEDLADALARKLAGRSGHQPLVTDNGPVCPRCMTAYPCEPAAAVRTSQRKTARQAARSVLPNATETRIVVTGNFRAWRHFINLRASEHADAEICAAAIAVLRELQRVAPNVFGDFHIIALADGREVARSHYVERD